MNDNFKSINFPNTFQYSSDSKNLPILFYESAFPKSKTIDMVLGYFSTNAIKALCHGFAEFIYNRGKLRIAVNHELSNDDKQNLLINTDIENLDKVINIFQDLEQLKKELSYEGQHFFDCLKHLLEKGDLLFVPIKLLPNNLAHFKKIILFDGDNYLYAHGSANFTYSGLLKNGESFTVDTSWESKKENNRINLEKENFELLFSGKHHSYKYLKPEEVEGIIKKIGNSKTEMELLEDASNINIDENISEIAKEILENRKIEFKEKVELLKLEPRFPVKLKEPRPYQIEAYNDWVDNGRNGLFAMATGTGKTITALNCILQEYYLNTFYRFIVLVPTRALVEQWENEVREKFNFIDVFKSGGTGFYDEAPLILNGDENFCIITTYASFKGKRFQDILSYTSNKDKITIIADEAHTIGSEGFRLILPNLKEFKTRIGLSATPSRYFDEEGEADVFNFFNINIVDNIPQYTASFTISQAINAKPKPFLCKYNYHIKFVELNEDELKKYREYTARLARFMDSSGKLRKCPEVENILKLRKDIVKKAKKKEETLIEIINEIGIDNFKYVFVYVPEGKEIDYTESETNWTDLNEDDHNIISDYTKKVNEVFDNNISIRHFTGETQDRKAILTDFEKGRTRALFAMKCLDEGVDVPRTEIAIFCSSTGNPRQYVQRRGRVLRLHENKKQATIYDMIVIPMLKDLTDKDGKEYKCERNLVLGEITRLIDFGKDSNNLEETIYNEQLIEICDFFEINLNDLINNII